MVFTGERTEAELVVNLLREEGFHPLLWADLPTPLYAGPIGMARVVVPPGEGDGARSFLSALGGPSAGEEVDPGLEGEEGEARDEDPAQR
ncbi:MAG: hypothetical protein H5T72_07585 [Actinobacteria bacterium]|nr:hypothetical protein [Actinomycetota bacterium]